MAIPVTAALTGFCGALLVGLATRISLLRVRYKVSFGDGGNADLLRAIRVHANTAEHAPIFILLSLAYELTRGSTTFLTTIVVAFVLSRAAYTVGVLARGQHQFRMAGASATYVTQAALAVALLFHALGA
jgi:uncharacterized membrane protein YecN with MAPEG domain